MDFGIRFSVFAKTVCFPYPKFRLYQYRLARQASAKQMQTMKVRR